jgi:queuosine precursor transporter
MWIIILKPIIMETSFLKNKGYKLFIILACFFIGSTIVAEFIGLKIFSGEKVFGLEPANFTLYGVKGLGFSLTAGSILWPIVFVMTDIINEYYGKRAVRFLSFLAVGIVFYAFLMVFGAIHLPPNAWWQHESGLVTDPQHSIKDMQVAFASVMGQGQRIIIGSMLAFLIGQLLDVYVFHKIKRYTGDDKIWLRATGSTLISQWIDSYIVLIVAFGGIWEWQRLLAIGTVNYIYKFVVAILLTPVIYLAHRMINRYLGREVSQQMRDAAGDDE